MSEEIANRFIEALGRLEAEQILDDVVALFAEDCDVGNVVTPRQFKGPQGAWEFWQSYRGTFGKVKSDFRNVIATGNLAALEWVSEGSTADGHPFSYEGVSILEIDGGKITRFRAYFDPDKLGRQLADEARA